MLYKGQVQVLFIYIKVSASACEFNIDLIVSQHYQLVPPNYSLINDLLVYSI